MRTLFVAAGGGGDAVGILLARRILDPEGQGAALITTCAWERLRIDPTPGPRPVDGFSGLGEVDDRAVEVLPSSDTVPAGRSMLPRLAAEADARIFLHDFERGAQGLARQLRDLVDALSADTLTVVDVGGDVVARGDEPNLLSPLADSLTLGAALSTEIPTRLAVLGPGTDAELSEAQVLDHLRRLGANLEGRIEPTDVQRCQHILDWHPTEASSLVAASALGQRGAVDMRRGRSATPLTEHGRELWVCDSPRIQDFLLAHAVAGSASLDEAVIVVEELAVNEIAFERNKAARLSASPPRPLSLEEITTAGMRNGATHITTRRLLEQLNADPIATDPKLEALDLSEQRTGGLWELSQLRTAGRNS